MEFLAFFVRVLFGWLPSSRKRLQPIRVRSNGQLETRQHGLSSVFLPGLGWFTLPLFFRGGRTDYWKLTNHKPAPRTANSNATYGAALTEPVNDP